MFFVRLAWGGVVELEDAVQGRVEGEVLVLHDATGRAIARFPRLDVTAFGASRGDIDRREAARR